MHTQHSRSLLPCRTSLYAGAGDPNSSLHACVVTLPAEPSHVHSHLSFHQHNNTLVGFFFFFFKVCFAFVCFVLILLDTLTLPIFGQNILETLRNQIAKCQIFIVSHWNIKVSRWKSMWEGDTWKSGVSKHVGRPQDVGNLQNRNRDEGY